MISTSHHLSLIFTTLFCSVLSLLLFLLLLCSGGVAGAEKGSLTFMVGASGQEFDTLQVTHTHTHTLSETETKIN
jgi:NAD binding domain of 6-phosphogluconate dehydrogenase